MKHSFGANKSGRKFVNSSFELFASFIVGCSVRKEKIRGAFVVFELSEQA